MTSPDFAPTPCAARPGGYAGRPLWLNVRDSAGRSFAAFAGTAQGPPGSASLKVALNGEQFVELLKQMMHRRRKSVHLILGNSPAHERAIVGEYVVSTEGG